MRHLNKIVFLNSANIPYAEVMLDGNVHFAGTQGVGKSTVLRALLFFYNADKMKLGIQTGQKTFEEFYFRHSNSYIVYEVKTDRKAYSILTSRSQGKVAFRFVDAPYCKEWLVADDGRVESDWIRIRERIGRGVDISAKIDTYELYRNIIFGNTHDRSHKYDKYAIVESSKYQNIPRSIQNVFLNSKLDADFVKNTIIQSMTDTEEAISLSTYRHLVADFEREFDEIDCWYHKDAQGEVPVRNKAAKVVDTYRTLLAFDYEMLLTWHQLNHVVAMTRQQLPLVEEEIRSLEQDIQKVKEKMAGAQREYDHEHTHLAKKIGACDLRLGDIRKKRKYYDDIGIQAIIELDGQQPKFAAERAQREKMLHALEERYRDVTEKYRTLYATLDDEQAKFALAQKEELQRFRDGIQTERDSCMKRREQRKKVVDDAYSDWLETSDERWGSLQQQVALADKRLAELRYWHPLEKDTEACKADIGQLKEQQHQLKAQLATVEADLKTLRQEGQMAYEKTEQDYARQQDDGMERLRQLQADLAATDELLARWKGSLYEWLTTNKPGWEENIGKVVDEQRVLYAQGLDPQLTEGDSLYGVRLQLDGVETHHRSPDEYRALRKTQQADVDAQKKHLADLQREGEAALDALRKRYNGRLAQLQQLTATLRVQEEQLPQKIRDAETRLHQLQRKEQQMVDEEREKRNAALNEARLRLDREKTTRSEQRNKRDKDLKAADNEYNAAMRDLQKRFNNFRQQQEGERESKQKDIDERRQLMQGQERDELRGKGADTQAIERCRADIEAVQRFLDRIAEQQHFVIEYRKDEEELLSHETEYRDEKRQWEAKDERLRQQYEEKRKRQEDELADHATRLKQRKADQKAMSEGLRQYDQLCQVEQVVPQALLHDDTATPNNNSCADLVVQMRGAVNKKRMKTDELKRAVNAFNSHFGTNNTFHFITPQYDEDYLEFALNLQDFIENDKIEMYRARVSEHYNTILHSISREVGMLINHSAEVKTIIAEVNRDFEERNFAGVIKSIQLRAEESTDRMMLLLKQIRDFIEENSFSIGELNLFSGDDRDKVNAKVVDYLKRLMKQLQREPARTQLTLSDTFRLQFRIQENDNNTGWVERINNVGSDGTDILVKAMVNIMLINVFKTRASRRKGDFIIHCMMDEIGKLHPSNVSGILQFANVRNIYLINSSPIGYNADLYKYNYLLTKDGRSQTHVKRLVTINA